MGGGERGTEGDSEGRGEKKMKTKQAIAKSVKSYIAHSTVSQTPGCFPVHVTCFCKYKCVCVCVYI